MRPFFIKLHGERTWFLAVALAGGTSAVAGVVTGFALSQCCEPPADAQPPADNNLARQVAQALDGHEQSAGKYAAFYELLAEQFDARHYETTTGAAQIAGRAADILELPGHLEQIVDDELNPHLGTPGPLTAQQSQAAAESLRDLAAACQEAVQ